MSGESSQGNKRKSTPVPARGNCPTPTKRTYYSRKFAKKTVKDLIEQLGTSKKGKLHVYKCVCGLFHIGSNPTRFKGPVTRHGLKVLGDRKLSE